MNLGQLRTALQQRGYEVDTAAGQTEAINAAYRRLAGEHRWHWLEKTGTLALTANTRSYLLTGLAADVVHIRSVRLRNAGSTTFYDPLEYLEPGALDDLYFTDQTTGLPDYWTRTDESLFFYPTPDIAYTAVIPYRFDPPDLSADGDTPLFPATYHDILVYGAIKDIAARERDRGMMEYAAAEYEGRKRDMRAQLGLVEEQTPGAVVQSGMYAHNLSYRWR